jgi:branched-chain amino acid transport system ATP-binding protein
MLVSKNVTMQFGGLTAVDNFSLKVDDNEIIGLIGPNGAGKTTVFNVITGVYAPTSGSVFFNGKKISRMPPHKITGLGIARTFQNIRLFGEMSVLENIMAAANLHNDSSMAASVLRLPLYTARQKRARELSRSLLDSVGLLENENDDAVSLPYGKQRRLEIARALATKPRLLLLDEPAAGMNPQESRDLMDFILKVRENYNIAVLLIEHHMQVVMGICERLYVLEYGITIAEGTPQEIQKNKKVIDAYLGAGE